MNHKAVAAEFVMAYRAALRTVSHTHPSTSDCLGVADCSSSLTLLSLTSRSIQACTCSGDPPQCSGAAAMSDLRFPAERSPSRLMNST